MNAQLTIFQPVSPIAPKDKLQLKTTQRISFKLGKRTATQELIFTGFNSELTFANFERIAPIVTEFFRYNK